MNWQRTQFRCVLQLKFPCFSDGRGGLTTNCKLPVGQLDDCNLIPGCQFDGPSPLPGAQCPFSDPKDILGGITDEGNEPSLGSQGGRGPNELYCDVPIAGQLVCFDILSVHSEFELNSIPSAVAKVAVGRRADDVTLAANIHYFLDCMQLQLPAIVWCEACTPSSSNENNAPIDPWPTGPFKIFEGYATGSGFQRSTTGADFTISLTHWLTDLSFSSAVSRQMNPLNARQFFWAANFTQGTQNTGGGGLPQAAPFMVGLETATAYFQQYTITEDFWGGDPGLINTTTTNWQKNGLKSWLLSISQQDRINQAQINSLGAGAGPADVNWGVNWEACKALGRFEPNAVGPDFNEAGCGYILGVPLGFPDYVPNSIDINVLPYLATSMADHLGQETVETYTNVTLWDKLAGQFHSDFMFSIVPLVEKALVVPFAPGLSSGATDSLVHRTLDTSDYESLDTQAMMIRPLRAVGILVGSNYQAGATLDNGLPAQYASFGGWFDKMIPTANNPAAHPEYSQGLIMFKEGPKWLNTVVPYDMASAVAMGVTGNISSATSPGQGGDSPLINSVRNVLIGAKPIWDLYAQSVYIHEILKQRQGTVTGPVRFDIAPGSTIKIAVAEDPFVKRIINYPLSNGCITNYLWCSVLRVSTTIDCQNMRAFTTFYIAHFRSESENNDPGTSVPFHPLWQRCQWGGCALVQDEAFSPVRTATCGSGGGCSSGPVITGISPNVGIYTGGTNVTITGTGFNEATLVMFGRRSANFAVNTDGTQITAVSPGGTPSTIVDILVGTGYCSSGPVDADEFTFTTQCTYQPTVTSVTPRTVSIEGTTSVTIKGTNFSGVVAVYFNQTEATYNVIDLYTINAIAPPDIEEGFAVDVTVVISTSEGLCTSATSPADQVVYGP